MRESEEMDKAVGVLAGEFILVGDLSDRLAVGPCAGCFFGELNLNAKTPVS